MDTSISPIIQNNQNREAQESVFQQNAELKEYSLLDRLLNQEEGAHFSCQVCQDLLQDPRECSKCRNVFCYKCIQAWQSNAHSFQTVCPLRQDHMATCDFLPINCEHCQKLISQGYMDYHLENQCELILQDCPVFKCKKGCQLEFPRNILLDHDCIRELRLVCDRTQNEAKLKEEKLKQSKQEIKQLKTEVKDKDLKLQELELQIQNSNLNQILGINANNIQNDLNLEEQKEQYYRRDPTFQCQTSKSVYQGGSIETILYLKNGHLAISGSSQNNKLVICDTNSEQPLEIIQELSDHVNTVTGLLELNKRLISCGIDKQIVVYEIVGKQVPQIALQSQDDLLKKNTGLFSCLFSKSQKQPKTIMITQYSYIKNNTIVNAHSSQINCLSKVSDELFATGATKEVKIWKFYECVHIIPNAHSNQILSIKSFMIMNSQSRVLEPFLVTGSKDKQLKLWNLNQILSESINQSEQNGINNQIEQSHRVRASQLQNDAIILPHYSQVNTFEQLNENILITGTSDGKVQIWKQKPQQLQQVNSNQTQARNFSLQHSSQIFTVSTLHIQLLTNYDYNEYPYVAIAGMVSKVIIFDVKNMTVIQSLRVLISNWQTFSGLCGIPQEEKLAVGCLDGTVKIYKTSYD
eukprot:403360704